MRDRIVETGDALAARLGVLSAQALTSGRRRWFAKGLGQDHVLQFIARPDCSAGYGCSRIR
ncbi:MAG: hypothetical protein ACJ8GV_15620 [Luteimonas sp.]